MKQTLDNNGQFDEIYLHNKMIRYRIACDCGCYPASEALYFSIDEWENHNQKNFFDEPYIEEDYH